MKNKIINVIFLTLFLTSCGVDQSSRSVFLSAKYKLTFAATISDYKLDMKPYFHTIPNQKDCISLFQKEESYFNFFTTIDNNGEPIGTGSYSITLNNFNKYTGNFSYYGLYDGVYGGEVVFIDSSKPSFLSKCLFRVRYWWVRMEVFFPEISDSTIILEFQFLEQNLEPSEFDHKIW